MHPPWLAQGKSPLPMSHEILCGSESLGQEGDVPLRSKPEHAELPNLKGLSSVRFFQKERTSPFKVPGLHRAGRVGFAVERTFIKSELSAWRMQGNITDGLRT